MILNGISLNRWKDYVDKQTKKASSPKEYFRNAESVNEIKEDHEKKQLARNISEDKGKPQEKTGTVTQVLVKPDGSRVLLIQVLAAGMETTMSLKLSEETDLPNNSTEAAEDSKEQHTNAAELPNQIANEMK